MLFPRLTSQPHQFLWAQCEIPQNRIRVLHPPNSLGGNYSHSSHPSHRAWTQISGTLGNDFPNTTGNMETPQPCGQQRLSGLGFHPHQTNKAPSPLTRVGQRRPSGEPGLSTHWEHRLSPARHTPTVSVETTWGAWTSAPTCSNKTAPPPQWGVSGGRGESGLSPPLSTNKAMSSQGQWRFYGEQVARHPFLSQRGWHQ